MTRASSAGRSPHPTVPGSVDPLGAGRPVQDQTRRLAQSTEPIERTTFSLRDRDFAPRPLVRGRDAQSSGVSRRHRGFEQLHVDVYLISLRDLLDVRDRDTPLDRTPLTFPVRLGRCPRLCGGFGRRPAVRRGVRFHGGRLRKRRLLVSHSVRRFVDSGFGLPIGRLRTGVRTATNTAGRERRSRSHGGEEPSTFHRRYARGERNKLSGGDDCSVQKSASGDQPIGRGSPIPESGRAAPGIGTVLTFANTASGSLFQSQCHLVRASRESLRAVLNSGVAVSTS